MDTMEIVLVVLGILAFIGSFFLPGGKKGRASDTDPMTQNEIKELVSKELQQIKTQVDSVAEEAVEYSMEKTERALERLSNEKIMAVSEYSDTVLKEISNNHKEAMFLYDLLNEKQKSIKLTMAELLRTVKEAETAAQSAGLTELETYTMPNSPAGQASPSSLGTGKPGREKATYETGVAGNLGARAVWSMASEQSGESQLQAQQEGNQNGLVLELFQQGKSEVEIAKELGLGVGEVKLVLDLYQK
jgi:hypothetical protein